MLECIRLEIQSDRDTKRSHRSRREEFTVTHIQSTPRTIHVKDCVAQTPSRAPRHKDCLRVSYRYDGQTPGVTPIVYSPEVTLS